MTVLVKPMGDYQTNCYIIGDERGEIIIDPGMGATPWVLANVRKPLAILNTHGHFDHVWSNAELQQKLNIPLYTPKEDAFLLKATNWMPGLPPSTPDILVEGEITTFDIGGISVTFRHFPGHCPGCSTIEIGEAMFSGDFIFERSIGRTDFPYSDPEAMKQSLTRFLALDFDKTLYPGHGRSSTIKAEQRFVPYWLENL
ncbi:MAG: MBL fold metallo-hydrolase [Campylobacterales bacterium]|nr:MBL fold metallo-hydrolase [Campylobacterales bacterium]